MIANNWNQCCKYIFSVYVYTFSCWLCPQNGDNFLVLFLYIEGFFLYYHLGDYLRLTMEPSEHERNSSSEPHWLLQYAAYNKLDDTCFILDVPTNMNYRLEKGLHLMMPDTTILIFYIFHIYYLRVVSTWD